MNRLLLLVCWIAITGAVYAQAGDTLRAKKIVITTSAGEFFPTLKLNTGNFNLGTEIYVGNRKSVYTNIGLVRSYGTADGWLGISAESTQGVKFQIEGRHYLHKRKIFQPAILLFWPHIFQYHSQELQNSGYYVGLHSFWQRTETAREEIIAVTTKTIYTVERNAVGLTIVLGYQCIKSYGLTVDHSVGFGGQFISSSSDNRLGPDTSWPNSEEEYPGKLFDSGSAFAPGFIYKVRLGWGF